jgi:ribosomal protein L14E/L6E/L27E
LVKGVGVMSQSHQGGAYFVHLQMDKLTSFELSEKDLKDLKAFINKTSGANVGSSMIKSDNSGASRIFAKGGQIPEWLFIGVYPNAYIFADKRIDNSGNYYEIGRIVFNPFQIRIFDNSSKYASAIEIINKEAKELEKQGYVEISATGQTVEIKKMSNGGETEEGVDLFEEYDNIPPKLQKILDKHQEAFEDGDYRGLEKALKEVNAIGYTFEYYLDGQAYDLRKIGEKGKSEVEEYAKGGTLKKYILKADIKTVTVKRNGKEVTFKGDDVLNGANVLAKGGDITSKANYISKRDVVEVELKDGSKVKPVNGYWVKKGAEPIGAELKPTSSVKSEPKINTTEIRKDARGNWRAETNIDNFNGYDWRLSTVKTYSGNLVSSAQGGKSEPSGTKGYSLFKYTVYEDPNHTLEVSKPKRLTDKVVSEQHDKALAKFKKFMETGMFKGGGKISNFDKLSAKVAKQYEGKPVKSQYQEEYGKYYSKEEAQEVGDKVAGKMKAMTTDKKAFGGFFGGGLKSSVKKYPNLDDTIVKTNNGKAVFVISQTSDSLLVIDANKIGTGVAPHRINISEIDPTSFKAGGKIRGKRVNGGTEMLKKANDLAKKIRKDGESWIDAKKRAFAQLKN